MKKEDQRIEWKESSRDEYLKSISGFANAEGGVLMIGVNDQGKAVGLSDARKLPVDLPNKVRDLLGILVDVNLKRSGRNEYLEIVVDALLASEPSITRVELRKGIGLTLDGIKYHLAKMTSAGLIRHVGSFKAGRWDVLKSRGGAGS